MKRLKAIVSSREGKLVEGRHPRARGRFRPLSETLQNISFEEFESLTDRGTPVSLNNF